MRLIGILGEPATGKTALMRAILAKMEGDFVRFKFGLLRGRIYTDERYVLGIYRESELFAGTDRLSMAVQPYAVKFVRTRVDRAVVAFEGDRLTRQGFLASVPYDALELYHLVCNDDERARRHTARGDTQPVSFTRSRRTLIQTILARFPAIELTNDTAAQMAHNAARIHRSIVNGAAHR
jgi:hypothetical protein